MTAKKGTDDHSGDDQNVNDKSRSAAQTASAAEAGKRDDNGRKRAGDRDSSGAGQASEQRQQTGSDDTKSAPQASPGGRINNGTAAAAASPRDAAAQQTRNVREPGGGDGNGRRGRLPLIVAVVALVVAIVALLAALWLWQHNKQTSRQLAQRVDNVQGNLQASVRDMVQEPLARLRSRVDEAVTTVNSATQAGQQRAQTVAQLQSQLQQTRRQLAAVAQQLHGDARRWWQLQQIEHLLTVANRRLQLYREPDQASSALQLASGMIARINDPRLFAVRKSIVDNIAALNALPSPDVAGMALKLSAFIDQVRDLPLASDMPANYEPRQASGQNDGADTGIDWTQGWHRFINSVGHAVKDMATIRRADGTQPALLPPDQVYFLTQNLMLELRAARLALLDGDTTLYHNSLNTATAWLKQYFDTGDAAVQAMLQGLQQLQGAKLEWQAPDISGSLRALRQYMHEISQADSADTGQQAPAATQPAGNEQGGK